MVKLNADCSVDIRAESLEDAVEKAKLIRWNDVADFPDNAVTDAEVKVYGVFELE